MKKVRNTVAKSHIHELLIHSASAMSQPEVYQQSEGVCDRVTAYRVLDRLLAEGHVHRVVGFDGVVRYAACRSCEADHVHQHHHVHFSCEKCGQVKCLENVIPVLQLPKRYKVSDANFTISGTCPACI